MVKVSLKVKRVKKGGEGTSQAPRKGEETFQVSVDAVLDPTLVSGLIPSALPTITDQRSSFIDPLQTNHPLSEHDQMANSRPSELNPASDGGAADHDHHDHPPPPPPPTEYVTISSGDDGSQQKRRVSPQCLSGAQSRLLMVPSTSTSSKKRSRAPFPMSPMILLQSGDLEMMKVRI